MNIYPIKHFFSRWFSQVILLLAGGLLVLGLQTLTSHANASSQASETAAPAPAVVQEALAAAQVLHYQGRLLEPATGAAKTDGVYPMTFHLYREATGGTALWSETKNVSVNQGRFTTLLGDTAPLNLAIFTGQELYLGIQVGSDLEATPRQRVAHVAYALFAESARNAELLAGQTASAFASAGHTHDGSAIDTGVLGEPRLPAEITRDAEVIGLVQSGDGAGSGIDADLLDGNHASAFALAGHNHDTSYFGRRRGTQFTDTLAVGQTVTYFTHSWATDEVVVWGVYPISPAGRVSWSVQTELEQSGGVGNGKIKYYISITNVASVATTVEARWVAFR